MFSLHWLLFSTSSSVFSATLHFFEVLSSSFSLRQSLGFEVEKYIASEVDEDAIKCSKRNHPEIVQVGDVRSITEENLVAWGPFDLMGKGRMKTVLANVRTLWKCFNFRNSQSMVHIALVRATATLSTFILSSSVTSSLRQCNVAILFVSLTYARTFYLHRHSVCKFDSCSNHPSPDVRCSS